MKKNERIKVKLEKASEIARCLSMFANEKRVQIALLLSEGEMNVGNIAETLRMPQSSVSLHLEKLFGCGLVERRRAGKNVYYKMNKRNMNNIIKLLTHHFTNKKIL